MQLANSSAEAADRIALLNTDVVQQFAELITTPGLTVTTPFGTNIIQELRDGGFLDEYERGSYSFSEYVGETISENFYDFDFIDSSITKYDYKRGFCTLSAEVKIPVEDLIMESPYTGDGRYLFLPKMERLLLTKRKYYE